MLNGEGLCARAKAKEIPTGVGAVFMQKSNRLSCRVHAKIKMTPRPVHARIKPAGGAELVQRRWPLCCAYEKTAKGSLADCPVIDPELSYMPCSMVMIRFREKKQKKKRGCCWHYLF